MTHLAVFSATDGFHRLLWQAVERAEDLQIVLRYRSPAEIGDEIDADLFLLVRPPSDVVQRLSGLELPVLILSDSDAPQHFRAIERSHLPGGVISDESSADTVLAAVRAVGAGLTVLDQPESAPLGVLGFDPPGLSMDNRPEGAPTPREREVLQLLARGMSNARIAESLGITENTVKYHLSGLYGSLNVHGRSEAILESIRRGWVSL